MKDLVKLRDRIQKLEKIHQLHILKIILEHNIPYTENSNGVFINIGTIDEKVKKSLVDYLEYVEVQETQLDEGEAERNKFKKNLENDYDKDNKEVVASVCN
jgi:hypothetical protein